jgi:2-methylcitrate dehydratase PrpD
MSQGFIEAILGLSEEHNIKPDNVAEITLRVTDTTKTFCEPLEERRRPLSAIDAKVALPFTAAVALVRQKVTLAEYLPETLKDPEVLALSRRVNYVAEPNFGHRNLEPAGVIIKYKDGREYSKYVEYSYGHPSKPISNEDLIAKFKDCCCYSVKPISERKQNRVIDMVTHLEEVSNVGEIISLLG